MAKRKGFNNYEILGNDAIIFLKSKDGSISETVIDAEDIPRLVSQDLSWIKHFDVRRNLYYITATEYLGFFNGKSKTKHHKLHRLLMDEENPKVIVDHVDGNTFNNRKGNLRKTDTSNNSRNRIDKNINNTSGYRNVTWISGYWRIQLQVDGKNKLFSEKFTDVDRAGVFAEEMRQKYYGEFAGRN